MTPEDARHAAWNLVRLLDGELSPEMAPEKRLVLARAQARIILYRVERMCEDRPPAALDVMVGQLLKDMAAIDHRQIA